MIRLYQNRQRSKFRNQFSLQIFQQIKFTRFIHTFSKLKINELNKKIENKRS